MWQRLLWRRRWRRLQQARQTAAGQCLSPVMAEWLQQPLPRPSQPLDELKLLAIDLETTGLDATNGAILSFGWVAIEHGHIRLDSADHRLINAAADVGASATIHGIRDCDQDQGETLTPVLDELFGHLQGRWPVFHHGALDLAFLDAACRRHWGCGCPLFYIDTLQWQQQRLRQQHGGELHQALHLSAVMDNLNLPLRRAHNALDDAQSCAEVCLALSRLTHARFGDCAQLWLQPAGSHQPTP
ncbi:MAG: exonuclease domain-containing protein [Wenzhouxiangellaceae bacterium]